MRILVWIIFWMLLVLHQDFWLWDDARLYLGFMPAGLAWHVGFSLVCAGFWVFATKFAWPSEIEAWAEEPIEAGSGGDQ